MNYSQNFKWFILPLAAKKRLKSYTSFIDWLECTGKIWDQKEARKQIVKSEIIILETIGLYEHSNFIPIPNLVGQLYQQYQSCQQNWHYMDILNFLPYYFKDHSISKLRDIDLDLFLKQWLPTRVRPGAKHPNKIVQTDNVLPLEAIL